MAKLHLGQKSVVRIRKIIHVDMDVFYASVDQMDNPSYAQKTVPVVGSFAINNL
ncbi:hypothetical protein PQG02_34220 (plasmid) [Nostoc sp. UHCC 0926]|uniref:hypothetical protein n=1 Tax=Nostoc sp. UHCC 0926 TaxID=3025190 RepID=UPI00235E10A9|nr:hypothetical protein [Nostoc sp. UHCC 0926]WDD36896.1 hypothetical protein PQG02_34220 [Nostoc sp. UHCC 0926]